MSPTELMQKVAGAIVETVEEEGKEGAPGSSLYLALQQHMPNLTATQFENFMNVLVLGGLVRREGQLYFPTDWREKTKEI